MANQILDLNNLPTGFITEKAVAQLFLMSVSGMRKYRQKGLIGFIKARGRIMYTADHIREFCKVHSKIIRAE